MANIQPRRNSEGKLVSYSIRVHKGRDSATGKQLKPYTMTWKVPYNWREKTAEKEAYKQAAIFEKQCKEGLALDNRQRGTFKASMARVAPEIGHMKIADIRVSVGDKMLKSGG